MSTATFIGTDTATGGLWQGVYGSTGYSKQELAGGNLVQSLPSGVTSIGYGGASTFGISTNSGNNRDLQRVAAPTTYDDIVWFDGTAISVTITVSDGTTRALAVYMRDSSASRNQTITIKEAGTLTVLDAARTVTGGNFTSGVYYRYEFSGSIVVVITNNGGPNAVIQG